LLPAGEAEAPATARNLARLKAAGMHNELLASLLNLDGNGENRADSLVERANLEALLSSGRFGNLLGGPRLSGPETGQVLNASELNSWRQKNGPLSLGRPAAAPEAERSLAGLGQGYLVRPPQRFNLGREARPEEKPSVPPAAPEKAEIPPAAAEPPAGSAAGDSSGKLSSEQLDKLVQKVALA
jgi:hypothetical protein